MLLGQPVRQIAYFVPDVRAAAERHSKMFGSGPFFVMDHGRLLQTHRGKEAYFEHRTAFGQWGDMQVELIEQISPGPSVLHDLFPEGSGAYGLHHMALLVKNLDTAVRHFAEAGCPEILRGRIPSMGIEGVIVDSAKAYGHYIELYEPVPALANFYAQIRSAAANFDGREPVRPFSFS
jgi:Glyoxalase/Bleomycin resistance protein/Dioxygenase superfamily